MSGAPKDGRGKAALVRACLTIEQLEAKLTDMARPRNEPIAIVGMGCRFPGGIDDADSFWRMLIDEADLITDVPPSRWNLDDYYDPDPEEPGKTYTRHMGYVRDIDLFDAEFFGISPREAATMDPQQRLLLETAWESLENAGQAPDKLAGSDTGVFVGVGSNDHSRLIVSQDDPSNVEIHMGSGSACSIATGRIAYALGLQGPTLSIDTACSSTLVAVHLACQALRAGECSLALAGGVNVILSAISTILVSKMRMLAPDGRCKTFDSSADGFVRSEGCGMFLLKRLSKAIADRDCIVAVIRGSAINQDGRSTGLTVPNGPAQEALLRRALAVAGLEPTDVGYVEAHGTGTSLGDPIEMQALGAVLGENRSPEHPLIVGSVKTNIGHTETAAGAAGLMKLLLTLRHAQIPRHLHLNTPNPHIPWEKLPVRVPAKRTPWPSPDRPRIGGVSSFGFSGTNAHVLVEESPPSQTEDAKVERPLHVLNLSAKSEPALRDLAGRYVRYFAEHADARAGDVCFTANTGRIHFSHRLSVLGQSPGQFQEGLSEYVAGAKVSTLACGSTAPGQRPRIGFLFTGQGSQYAGMARELYDTQPTFRKTLQQCDELLRPHMDRSLLKLLFDEDEPSGRLNETVYQQPVLFALEYGLATLWRCWGIEPTVMMGHSVGEYVAACVAGVFSLEDGLRLIAARARLMHSVPGNGAMASVFAPASQITAALDGNYDGVSIAAVNGPEHVVISGTHRGVEDVISSLASQGIEARSLRVSHAFHSALMEPMLDEFENIAAQVACAQPNLDLISNVTGQSAGRDELCRPAYWREHVRRPVRFLEGMGVMADQGIDIFLEIGPGTTLLGMGRLCLEQDTAIWLNSLRRGQSDWQQMLASLGKMYVAGADVDFAGLDADYPRSRLPLPTYPFQRRRHWFKPLGQPPARAPGTTRRTRGATHPLLGDPLRSALREAQFESLLSAESPDFLTDHRVHGLVILAAAGYLEMALAAGRQAIGESACRIEDVAINEPMVLHENTERIVQTILRPTEPGVARFEIMSLPAEDESDPPSWTLHASGIVREDPGALSMPQPVSLESLRGRCEKPVPVDHYYERLAEAGLSFGPKFQGIEGLWAGDGESLARLQIPESTPAGTTHFHIHPVLLDAMFQSIGGADTDAADTGIYVPVGLDAFRFFGPAGESMWCHGAIRQDRGANRQMITVDLRLFDDAGRVVAEAQGLRLKHTTRQALLRITQKDLTDWLYEIQWEPAPTPGVGAARELAAPNQVAQQLRCRLTELVDEFDLSLYGELIDKMGELSVGYVLAALRQSGWTPSVGQRFAPDDLADQLDVVAGHRRLFGSMLDMLSASGILRAVPQGWEVRRELDPPDTAARSGKLIAEYPSCRGEIELLARCGRRLADVLKGRCDPLTLLFPDGSVSSMEQVYESSPFAKAGNRLVSESLASAVQRVSPNRSIRVLEIGAGTGGTTSSLLDQLPPDRTEYAFTDVSPLFLAHAKLKFTACPFVRHELLDISRDPDAQGFRDRRFDIVLAANVLHATEDLQQTLGHVRRLLAPGGLLMLVETTARMWWADLVFGLTEGWWKFADTDLRPDYPLLNRNQWLSLLARTGFEDPALLGMSKERGEEFQQSLFLARKPIREEARRDDQISSRSDAATPTPWLIFADRAGVGDALAAQLKKRGQACLRVLAGDDFAPGDPGTWRIDPSRPEHFHQLLEEIRTGDDAALAGVVHLWPLDAAPTRTLNASTLSSAEVLACASTLHLVQALAAARQPAPPGMWLVTRGAQPVTDEANELAVAQGSLWGLGRVIAREHPNVRCVTVDIDPAGDADAAAEELSDALLANDREDQIAFRQGRRFVARLTRSEATTRSTIRQLEMPANKPCELQIDGHGVLDNLHLVPVDRKKPGPDEVEIRVAAAGLNFRDVLNALDMLPAAAAGPLGGECAGTVARVGEQVTEFKVGDEVVAFAPSSFGTFAITNAHLVVPKPAHLTVEEAATIPTTFWTAYYGLCHCAKISPGDRILIHAAAGGVGLAAVQLAQNAGAEIFATAGSPHKRQYLRSIGVPHVMDSRSLDFADQIMKLTDGRGVDVVLNSLAGEFIPKSLSVLAPGGRFVELGKTGIWSKQQVARFKEDVSYDVVLLDRMLPEEPHRAGSVYREVMASFENRSLQPLVRRVFPITEAISAFRYMAQARHIGKIVLSISSAAQSASPLGDGFRSDATYLITGGLTGIGLVVARWMVERGARHLVLMARRRPSDSALDVIGELEAAGAQVRVLGGDVSRETDVAGILTEIAGSMPPLRGVFHSAGVLDDGVLANQTWERFETVFSPKVTGTWILHEQTADLSLDFFVLFSTAAALLGSVGQGNHAAANAFMDGMAHYRRANNLPATSINWGPWAEIGSVTQVSEEAIRKWKAQGFGTMSTDEGIRALEEVFERNPVQVGVLPIDWSRFARLSSAGQGPALLAKFAAPADPGADDAPPSETEKKLLRDLQRSAPADRFNLLRSYVTQEAVKVLGIEPSRCPQPGQHLGELGLDSLMAVELKNSLERGVGRPLPTTLVFDFPSITDLVGFLDRELSAGRPEDEADAAGSPAALDEAGSVETAEAPRGRLADDEIPAEVADLSDEQVDAMLGKILDEKEGR